MRWRFPESKWCNLKVNSEALAAPDVMTTPTAAMTAKNLVLMTNIPPKYFRPKDDDH